MAESKKAAYAVGTKFAGPTRTFTLSRRRWYSAGLRTAATGVVSQPMMGGIHDDYDYARGQGMKAPIIDGMTVTNWCSALLIKHFGLDYIAQGDLRTKYIKPIYMEEQSTPYAKVLSAESTPNGGIKYELDVWCENQDGLKVTDGHATVVTGVA